MGPSLFPGAAVLGVPAVIVQDDVGVGCSVLLGSLFSLCDLGVCGGWRKVRHGLLRPTLLRSGVSGLRPTVVWSALLPGQDAAARPRRGGGRCNARAVHSAHGCLVACVVVEPLGGVPCSTVCMLSWLLLIRFSYVTHCRALSLASLSL